MATKLKAPIIALLALVATSCGELNGPVTVDTEWSGNIARGDAIEIRGVNGDIIASPTSGNSVLVTITKEGRDSDPTEVEIEVVNHEGGITICAMYPDVPGELPNVCAPGSESRMNTRDNDVEVTFRVAVPDGVDLVACTVNGSVIATGLESDVFAYTVNGDVDLSTTRHPTASTVNGSIYSRTRLTDLDYDLGFTSVNGDVSVEVPSRMNADVSMSTVHGNISADISLTIVSPGNIRGVLGHGGMTIAMSTVNGSLDLDTER